MQHQCSVCGQPFDAKTARARYCSGRCKKRAADQRSRTGTVVSLRPDREAPAAAMSPGIGAAMLAQFPPALLESAQGALALKVAADIDQSQPGAPGVAAMVRELRALISELQAQTAPKQANPLVLLRQRHADAQASG